MMFSASTEHTAVLSFYVIRNGGEVYEEYIRDAVIYVLADFVR